MSVFDILDLGAGLFSAEKAARAMNKLKREHPEAYECFKVLNAACINHDLDFQAAAVEDNVILYSKTLVNGLFNQPDFKCFAHLDPTSFRITFSYFPEYANFVVSNSDKNKLVNWVNQRLRVGKLQAGNISTNMVGKEIQQLVYSIVIPCVNVPKEQLSILVKQALLHIENFREIFMPIIKPLSEIELSISNSGEITGNSASQALAKHNQARSQFERGVLPKKRESLINKISQSLEELGYANEYFKEQTYFLVQPAEAGENALHLIVTPGNQIMLQSYPLGLEDRLEVIASSDYLVHVSTYSNGNFHVNFQNNQLVYRVGLDVQGLETILSSKIVKSLFNVLKNDTLMPFMGFHFVESSNTPYIDIMEKLLDGAVPEDAQPTLFPSSPPSTESTKISSEPEVAPGDIPEAPKDTTHPPSSPLPNSKNRTSVLLFEALPALIGIFGVGWLYAGNTMVGLIVLIAGFAWDLFSLVTIIGTMGIAFLCLIPIHLGFIGLSGFLLSDYIKKHPDRFV